MVNSRTETRLDRLEKATDELTSQLQQTDERVAGLSSRLDAVVAEIRAGFAAITAKSGPGKMKLQSQKLADQIEDSIVEIRALRASPLTKFPKFDGSEALAWLARANQYFITNNTPLDRRVDVAIKAISGPAMPWLKLLLMCYSSLTWDKFTQELLRRFGDAAIAAVRVAKIQPKIPHTSNDNTSTILPPLPTVTAPLLSSSLPTTAKKNTLHAIQQPLPLALPQQQPWQNMELVPQPAPVPALVDIHHLEAVPVPIHMSTSDAQRNTVLHSLPKKHFTTIYFSSQSAVQCRQYSAIGFGYIQSFSSIHILCGLLFCTLLSSLKHESAPPWLNSTLALRARLFRQ